MTLETAIKARDLLAQIQDATRVLTIIEREEAAWFGTVGGDERFNLPAECVSGARVYYRKKKEWAEAELEKL